MYLGSWKIDDYLTFPANTHNPSTGAAADADAVPAYRVYEDETATPLLTGNMALLDGDNTVGFYSERIQLTAASGFEKSKAYTIYISAAVGAVTGTISHTFQIEAEVDANAVSDKTGYGLADDALTAAKFDESTAFPLKSADTGATAVSRTGADSDTLETLSDQLDALQTDMTEALGYIDTEVAAILEDTAAMPTAAAIADAVWDELATGHTDAGKAGQQLWTDLDAVLADSNELQTDWHDGGRLDLILDAAGSAGDHWSTALPGAYGAGTAGKIVGDNLNATVSSRSSHAAADVAALVLVTPANKLTTDGDGKVTYANAAPPTAASIADAVWDELATGHTDAGKAGQQLWTDLDAALADTNELQTNQGSWLTATGFSTHSAADVWSVGARTLTSGANIVLAKGVGVTGFNDLSAAEINAEMADVLKVDVIAEPAQGAPPATPTFQEAQAYLYFNWRNEHQTTASEDALMDNAGTTKIVKAALSDDSTTFTKDKYKSGA